MTANKKKILIWGIIIGVIAIFIAYYGIKDANEKKRQQEYMDELNAIAAQYHEDISSNIGNLAKNEDCDKILCLVVENGEEKYTKEFVPEELVAQSAEEAAIVVTLTKGEILKGTYTGGSKGWQHKYDLEWKNYKNNVTMYKTFYGSEPPSITYSDASYIYGDPPNTETISQWMRDIYENPYITESIGGFNFVCPASYKKNEENSYQNNSETIELVEYSKVGYEGYTIDEFLSVFKLMLMGIEGYSDISDIEANANGVPYLTYRHKGDITIYGYPRYAGVVVVYETDEAFWAVIYEKYYGTQILTESSGYVGELEDRERYLSYSLLNSVSE